MAFHVPNKDRIRKGHYASENSIGNSGAFIIDRGRTKFMIVASDSQGYEHVSVHAVSDGKERTCTWSEMCYIKDIFWDKTDTVVQFHPKESEYVNMHKYTLHLWRKIGEEYELPPAVLVGVM